MQQFDLASISVIIASASVIVGVILAILQLRDQVKNRQAQLVIQLYAQFSNPEFLKNLRYVNDLPNEDAADDGLVLLTTRNEKFQSISAFFEGVGVLVKRGLIDINLVADLLSTPIILAWQAIEPYVLSRRKAAQRKQIWDWFEYLYNRIQSLPQKAAQEPLKW